MPLYIPPRPEDRPWVFEPNPVDTAVDLAVVDVFEAEALSAHADHILSFWNTPNPNGEKDTFKMPDFVELHPSALVLEMDDVDYDHDGYQAPTRAQVERIVLFSSSPILKGRILVHCQAGISRSSAAALVLFMTRLRDPQLAILALLRSIQATHKRGWREVGIHPNSAVVRHADDILGCNGAFMQAFAETFGASWEKNEQNG